MNISIQKLIGKIEKELLAAKAADSEARLRERIHAVKTMCELILEDSQPAVDLSLKAARFVPSSQPQTLTVEQPGRMQMEDEANGESLFDF